METLDNKVTLMTKEELTGAVHGTLVGLAENLKNFSFTSVVTDSRNVVRGSLFVPLVGEFQDGHKYIPQAIEKGATVVFISENVYEENCKYYMKLLSEHDRVTFIVVKNNLYALQDAARAYVNKFDKLIKVAVTGSSGKTTTKEIMAAILRQRYNLIATEGNFNSETGLPLSVFKIRKEHECGLFEMGMNRENEIGEIARVFKPNYAIITNIGTAHIGILKSRENIAKEKKKIFSYIKKQGVAVIPKDDDFAKFLAEGVAGQIVYFGKNIPEKESGVRFIENLGLEGTKFAVDGIETVLKIPGEYNYLNALSCIALARKLGLSAKEIAEGIASLKAPEGRSKIENVKTLNGKNITLLKDCYNANPDSMSSAIEMCAGLKVKGRKIFILGDMFELGKDSADAHSKVGADVIVAKPDFVFFAGRDMEFAAKAAMIGGLNRQKYYENLEGDKLSELTSYLLDYLKDDDFIFVKGSHGMHLEKIIEKICGEEL
ncbi:UDP-N-acetylmuramoyl-tripeptide--D-alanyl-D-alanine ligase [Treponema sp.]|uniref:UDP-N-acetylmuramoyl-tripeptide--D-alanyl-D- alanine ligase n=1 Tax=Treponema sp. TaxID=166 RepID=UPI00298ECC97|nr:UDP-N-acetylmuramoyl-tripeptide--D-alanyl-D-alanine ligase [Treponema sp.]